MKSCCADHHLTLGLLLLLLHLHDVLAAVFEELHDQAEIFSAVKCHAKGNLDKCIHKSCTGV